MNNCHASGTCFIAIRIASLLVLVATSGLFCFAAGHSAAVQKENSFRDYFPQIESADWQAISRGCPIDHEENEILTRILDGLENIPEGFWKAAANSNTATLADSIATPTENCGRVFSLSGKCAQVKPPWNFVSGTGTGFVDPNINHLNGQRIQISCDDGSKVWVMTHSLPRQAGISFPEQPRFFIDQPVSCHGMFLFAESDGPVLVTRQVHWRPIAESAELNIGMGQLELVRAGFDFELLDRARNYTDMALVPEEKELFDRILAAAHTLSEEPGCALQGQGKLFDIVDLVQHPTQNTGSLIQVEGTLRRVAPVVIDDPELRKAINGDRYYQLDVFVPLGNKRIQLGSDKQNKPIEVTGEYGITVIAARLPDEILSATLPVRIQVPAFMLKIWEHTSLATATALDTLRRPNPILIAVSSQLQPVAVSDAHSQLFVLIPLIGFGILGILGILFFLSRNRTLSFQTQKRVVENPDFGVLFDGDSDESQARP